MAQWINTHFPTLRLPVFPAKSGEGFSPWELSSEFTNWLSEVRPPGMNSFVSHQETKQHFSQRLLKIGGLEFRQTLRATGIPVGKALCFP